MTVFKKLDERFADILRNFSENGQIDVFPKKGKQDGGFCVYMLKTQPIYVLLNYANLRVNVRTLAHEFGHAINGEFMRENQNSLNFNISLATAEVASTFMEDFVLQELMEKADDELKLSLMIAKLGDDVSKIFSQIACYEFEQELHEKFREKGYLSKEEIGTLFQKHMSSYMGEYVKQSPGSENWWIYWSHIRRYFYVYSYASGLLISKALQRKVKENPEFIEKVKKFLSAGTSKSPEEIFSDMGIKLNENFWNQGLDEVEGLVNKAEKLAKKLGKI